MNVGDIVYDKDLMVFGQIVSWVREKDGFVYTVKGLFDLGGRDDNETFVSSNLIPYKEKVEEELKRHEEVIDKLKSLEKLEKRTKEEKLYKLVNDFLDGKVTADGDYDYEDWCQSVAYALRNR